MTDNDKDMERIAELTVRRFFEQYLDEVFPVQLERAITAHNKDVTAHKEQIKAGSDRLKLWVYGGLIAAGGGLGGAGLLRVITRLVGSQ